MNSDLIPPSKPSNATSSDRLPTSMQASAPTATPSSTETAANEKTVNRQQPIPPPSEPMQYRAIGLVQGRYIASAEQLTQGQLITSDGTELQAVLLGRIISLVRNHIDLAQEHLWVVYPRTGQKHNDLHLQIVGVWEPEKLSKESVATQRVEPEEQQELEESGELPVAAIEDGYFSIRGEIVFQSTSEGHFVVKIKQSPRKDSDKPKYFKIRIKGVLQAKAVGQFWDLQAKRQADDLVLQQGEAIATLPSKPKPPRKKLGRGGYQGGYQKGRGSTDTPRPITKAGSSKPVPRPTPKSSTPKPIKRPKPPQE